ncbi:hypothetical protein AK812_SmicGene10427 [Symbiodinium microadriaticum]|uniref:Uncharacterized protein n=1 Tax=Symbiodinium microadriaticum TaxID=2951 RepID=A0A1Q9EFV7_SYMMI|nr:hypothetical protein AK812_SmicGene10427 [Symbiodinium microadriaticum]
MDGGGLVAEGVDGGRLVDGGLVGLVDGGWREAGWRGGWRVQAGRGWRQVRGWGGWRVVAEGVDGGVWLDAWMEGCAGVLVGLVDGGWMEGLAGWRAGWGWCGWSGGGRKAGWWRAVGGWRGVAVAGGLDGGLRSCPLLLVVGKLQGRPKTARMTLNGSGHDIMLRNFLP